MVIMSNDEWPGTWATRSGFMPLRSIHRGRAVTEDVERDVLAQPCPLGQVADHLLDAVLRQGR